MKNLWLFVFCLLFCQSAAADTYFFVGSHFPILSEETENGQFSGIAIDVATIIGHRLGHTITIRLYPWERAKYMVETGMADVLMAPYKSPDRETWLDYSENYFFIDKVFFYVRQSNAAGWNGSYTSLQGRKIGLVQGWSVDARFDQIKTSLCIDYGRTLDICFKKLLAGRIDMIPTSVREAKAAFVRLRLGKKEKPVIIRPALATNYNYFGFTRQRDLSVFKQAFDRQLSQMKANKEISLLLKDKYGLSDEELR